jgi:hypothetical protein
VLIQEKIDCLRDAVEVITKRKIHKRQYIRAEETLTVGEVANLVAATVVNSCDDSRGLLKRVRAERRCGRCSETRHNSCIYKVEIEDTEDSNKSN